MPPHIIRQWLELAKPIRNAAVMDSIMIILVVFKYALRFSV
jgi:hypothetical protein